MTKYKRLGDMSRTVWSLLTEEERERYASNNSTISFVADVAKILDIEVGDLLVELFDEILEKL